MRYIISSLLLIIFAFSVPISLADIKKDKAIEQSVKKLLSKENDIPKIKIKSENGIVQLIGKVETSMQAHYIVEVASSVRNVTDINTEKLEVKNSKEFLSDAFITAKAKGKIKYLALNEIISPNYELHIETTNQIVHIFGKVGKEKDIKIIKNAIDDIIDVQSVKINIFCK